jgi:hypothetical protein
MKRKIIHLCAEDSPNVALALRQIKEGKEPTGEEVCPGVLTWEDYRRRRATWDRVSQVIHLDGQFYVEADASVVLDSEGREVKR